MSRSNNLTEGAARAPHRSLLKGLGFVAEEMDRPIIGNNTRACTPTNIGTSC